MDPAYGAMASVFESLTAIVRLLVWVTLMAVLGWTSVRRFGVDGLGILAAVWILQWKPLPEKERARRA